MPGEFRGSSSQRDHVLPTESDVGSFVAADGHRGYWGSSGWGCLRVGLGAGVTVHWGVAGGFSDDPVRVVRVGQTEGSGV